MSWQDAAKGAEGGRPSTEQRDIFKLSRAVSYLLIPAVTARAQQPTGGLKGLSLEQLGEIEVTTATKQPVQVNKTPKLHYLRHYLQEDIRRSASVLACRKRCGSRRASTWRASIP